MALKNLGQNIEYVNSHWDELLENHSGKHVLVHEGVFIDAFDDYKTSASEGIRRYGLDGDFLVRQISDKKPLNFVIGARF
jgi:hypothetical protein